MGIIQEATIDYAVLHLGVEHLVICGHSHCGAIEALMDHNHADMTPAMQQWLDSAEDTRQCCLKHKGDYPDEQDFLMHAIQANVSRQLYNVASIPSVSTAVSAGKLQLHGWVYCLESGQVLIQNNLDNTFHPLPPRQGPSPMANASLEMPETETIQALEQEMADYKEVQADAAQPAYTFCEDQIKGLMARIAALREKEAVCSK